MDKQTTSKARKRVITYLSGLLALLVLLSGAFAAFATDTAPEPVSVAQEIQGLQPESTPENDPPVSSEISSMAENEGLPEDITEPPAEPTPEPESAVSVPEPIDNETAGARMQAAALNRSAAPFVVFDAVDGGLNMDLSGASNRFSVRGADSTPRLVKISANFTNATSEKKIVIDINNGLSPVSLPGMVRTGDYGWAFSADTLPRDLQGSIIGAEYAIRQSLGNDTDAGVLTYTISPEVPAIEINFFVKLDRSYSATGDATGSIVYPSTQDHSDAKALPLTVKAYQDGMEIYSDALESIEITGDFMLGAVATSKTFVFAPGQAYSTGPIIPVRASSDGLNIPDKNLRVLATELTFTFPEQLGVTNLVVYTASGEVVPPTDYQYTVTTENGITKIHFISWLMHRLHSYYTFGIEGRINPSAPQGTMYPITTLSPGSVTSKVHMHDGTFNTKYSSWGSPYILIGSTAQNLFLQSVPEAYGSFNISSRDNSQKTVLFSAYVKNTNAAPLPNQKMELKIPAAMGVTDAWLPVNPETGGYNLIVKTTLGRTLTRSTLPNSLGAGNIAGWGRAVIEFEEELQPGEYISYIAYEFGTVPGGIAENVITGPNEGYYLALWGKLLDKNATSATVEMRTVQKDQPFSNNAHPTYSGLGAVVKILPLTQIAYKTNGNTFPSVMLAGQKADFFATFFYESATGFTHPMSAWKGHILYVRQPNANLQFDPAAFKVTWGDKVYSALDGTLQTELGTDKDGNTVYKLLLPDVIFGRGPVEIYPPVKLEGSVMAKASSPAASISKGDLFMISPMDKVPTFGSTDGQMQINYADTYNVTGDGTSTMIGHLPKAEFLTINIQKAFNISTSISVDGSLPAVYDGTPETVHDVKIDSVATVHVDILNGDTAANGFAVVVPVPKKGAHPYGGAAYGWSAKLAREVLVSTPRAAYNILYATEYLTEVYYSGTTNILPQWKTWGQIENKEDIKAVLIETTSLINEGFSQEILVDMVVNEANPPVQRGEIDIFKARTIQLLGATQKTGWSSEMALRLATGRISGTVFADSNRNGVLDNGEAGMAGVQVDIFAAGHAGDEGYRIAGMQTAADGTYALDNTAYTAVDIVVTNPRDPNPQTAGSMRFNGLASADGGLTGTASSVATDGTTLNAGLITPTSLVFKLNGGKVGDNTSDITIPVYQGTTVTAAPDAHRDGFVLTAWKDAAGNEYQIGDGLTGYTLPVPAADTIDLTAVWGEIGYTLSLHAADVFLTLEEAATFTGFKIGEETLPLSATEVEMRPGDPPTSTDKTSSITADTVQLAAINGATTKIDLPLTYYVAGEHTAQTSKTVTVHIVSAVSPGRDFAIRANDVRLSKAEVGTFGDADYILRANAKAWDATDALNPVEKPVETVNADAVQAALGTYAPVTFGALGVSTNVKATVHDETNVDTGAGNEGVAANHLRLSVAEAQQYASDAAFLAGRAEASAWKHTTGEALAVSLEASTILPQIGVYTVTFAAPGGTAVTVNATVFDDADVKPDPGDPGKQIGIGANHFRLSRAEAEAWNAAADGDASYILRAMAASWVQGSDEKPAISTNAKTQVVAAVGEYQVTFRAGDSTATVTATVYDEASVIVDPENPGRNIGVAANHFRMSVAEAQAALSGADASVFTARARAVAWVPGSAAVPQLTNNGLATLLARAGEYNVKFTASIDGKTAHVTVVAVVYDETAIGPNPDRPVGIGANHFRVHVTEVTRLKGLAQAEADAAYITLAGAAAWVEGTSETPEVSTNAYSVIPAAIGEYDVVYTTEGGVGVTVKATVYDGTATVSGMVFIDANRDGVFSTGEGKAAFVPVRAYTAGHAGDSAYQQGATVYTDAFGLYELEGLTGDNVDIVFENLSDTADNPADPASRRFSTPGLLQDGNQKYAVARDIAPRTAAASAVNAGVMAPVKVSFNVNGGTTTDAVVEWAYPGKVLGSAPAATKDGNQLGGWLAPDGTVYDIAGGEAYNVPATGLDTIELVAQWNQSGYSLALHAADVFLTLEEAATFTGLKIGEETLPLSAIETEHKADGVTNIDTDVTGSITADTAQLAAINGATTKIDLPLTYYVAGEHTAQISKTVTVHIVSAVSPDRDFAIRANDVRLSKAEAGSFGDADYILRANAKAWDATDALNPVEKPVETVNADAVQAALGTYAPVTFGALGVSTNVKATVHDETNVDTGAGNEGVAANHLRLSVAEAQQYANDAAFLAGRAEAAAWKHTTGEALAVSLEASTILPQVGVYTVTFAAPGGTAVTVNATVFDDADVKPDPGDPGKQIGIGANHFRLSRAEAEAWNAAADGDASYILRAMAASWVQGTDEKPAISTNAKTQVAAAVGEYQVTFRAGDSTATVTATVYDEAALVPDPGNPDRVVGLAANHFRVSADEVRQFKAADDSTAYIERSNAIAWVQGTSETLPVSTNALNQLQPVKGVYDVTFTTENNVSVTVKAQVYDATVVDPGEGTGIAANNLRLSVAEAGSFTGAQYVQRAMANAWDTRTGAALPVTLKETTVQPAIGDYLVTFNTRGGVETTVVATVYNEVEITGGEGVAANHFVMDLDEVGMLDDAVYIERSKANAWNTITGADVPVTGVDASAVEAKAGSYPVIFSTAGGASVTVYATVKEGDHIGEKDNEMIRTYDFLVQHDVVESLTGADYVALARAKAWNTHTGADVPITQVDPSAAKPEAGTYKVWYSTDKGTKTFALMTVQDGDHINVAVDEVLQASDFSIEMNQISTLTKADYIRLGKAKAWTRDGENTPVEVTGVNSDAVRPLPGRYPVEYSTAGGITVVGYVTVVPSLYKVSFVTENGVATPPSIMVEYHQLVPLPTAPEKTGYVLTGWYTAGGEEWNFAQNKMPDSELVLHARFELNEYVVTFNQNGAGPDFFENVKYGAAVPQPASPELDWYTFMGWFDQNGRQWDFGRNTMPANNITLTAGWKQTTFVVTYMADGRVVAYETVKTGQLVPHKEAPHKGGFDFQYWSGEGHRWLFDRDTMPAHDMVMTAVYEQSTPAASSSSSSSRRPGPTTSSSSSSSTSGSSSAPASSSSAPPVQSATSGSLSYPQPPVSIVDIVDRGTPIAGWFGNSDSWALLSMVLALVSLVADVLLAVGIIRRKRENKKGSTITRIVAFLMGFAAIAVFLLTSNFAGRVVLVNGWTVIIAILSLIQLILSMFARNMVRDEEDDEDEEEPERRHRFTGTRLRHTPQR